MRVIAGEFDGHHGPACSFTPMNVWDLRLKSGEPINEPVVGHGPFVMSTKQEIPQAIEDYNNRHFGSFS